MARIGISFIKYVYSVFQSAALRAAVCHDQDCWRILSPGMYICAYVGLVYMCICGFSLYVH